MSRKNFKVATAENGKTPTQNKKSFATTNIAKKDNTPTGKVKTIVDKEELRKRRETEYRNFRINALKRRAKRMGLSEEQTKVKLEELTKQLDTPNSYNVLILFSKKDKNLVKQALLKENLVYSVMSDEHLFIEADQETLATLRSIMPPTAKIHPYTKKKPPILPTVAKSKAKAKRPGPKKAKAIRKREKDGIYLPKGKSAHKKQSLKMHNDHNVAADVERVKKNKKKRKIDKAFKLFQKRVLKASKKKGGTTVQLKPKTRSTGSKKASTLKKAA